MDAARPGDDAVPIDLTVRPGSGLVVLRYSGASNDEELAADIESGLFAAQVEALADHGGVIFPDAAITGIRTGADLTGRVMITVDDPTPAFADRCLASLCEQGMGAALFVTVAPGVEGSADRTHLARLARLPGMSVEVRSVPGRPADSDGAALIDRAIDTIAETVGEPPRYFARRYLSAGAPGLDDVVRARFDAAVGGGGRPNPIGTDPFALTRTSIDVCEGLRWLDHALAGGVDLSSPVRHVVDAGVGGPIR